MSEVQCVTPEDENPVGNRLKYGELRSRWMVAVLVQRRVFTSRRESSQGLVGSWKLERRKKTAKNGRFSSCRSIIHGRKKYDKTDVLHGVKIYFCIACSAKYSKGLFPQSVRQFESDSVWERDMMSSMTSCAPG